MLQPYRNQFNSKYTSAAYDDLLTRMNRVTRASVDFRIAETPCAVAVTLVIGIICSLFTGFFCTRLVYDWWVRGAKVKRLSIGAEF